MAFDLIDPTAAQAKRKSFHCASVRPPGGGDLPFGLVRHGRVAEAVLHQESAPDALVIEGLIVAELRELHDPQILLLLEHREGLGIDARCDDDLHEQVAHRLGGRAIDDGVNATHEPNADVRSVASARE